MYRALLAGLAVTLSCSALAEVTAEQREGLVVFVHDGDTLTVLVGKQQVKVRLAEIYTPELRQTFGQRVRQSLAELCFQESAKVELVARERQGLHPAVRLDKKLESLGLENTKGFSAVVPGHQTGHWNVIAIHTIEEFAAVA